MRILYLIGLGLLLQCHSTFAQDVVVIPNIFTPDGDGINDVFRIQNSGFEQLTCTIYNRHGEPVYRFYGINGSWDGYTHAGVKVTPGVYFVIVELVSADPAVGEKTQQGTLQVHY